VKKISLVKKLKNDILQCQACSWYCKIPPGETGICGVRRNIKGNLVLLPYGKAVGLSPDPVEKKPLFHFLPGTKALSFGTLGCNFSCDFCQNWFQSQSPKETKKKDDFNKKHEELDGLIEGYSRNATPKEIVSFAKSLNCRSIAYTYNEPTVFIEYAYDTMVLAKKARLKNIFVSNGYESNETFFLLKDYLDAINIDLKSFRPDFYQKICKAKIAPVLDNIKKFWQAGIWVEVTTLVIPGENDSTSELKDIAKFLAGVSKDMPWHISAFHPDYKMIDRSRTSHEKLREVHRIGKEAGLHYVYLGNVSDGDHTATYCPNCQNKIINRDGYNVEVFGITKGKCRFCSTVIAGIWK